MDGIRNQYITKKTIRSMLVASIMTVLVSTLGTMINSIFVGWFLGSDQLAALGVASSISLVFAAVAGMLNDGGNVTAAIYIGKNQKDNVNNIFTLTLAVAVLIGFMLTLLITLTATPLAVIFGAQDQLISPAADYIRGMGLGIIPVMLAAILMNFVRVDGSINLPLIATGAMIGVNCVLDVLMLKVLDTGLLGVAWATDISYVVAILVCCLHFRRGHHSLKLCKMTNLVKELKAILWVGLPSALAPLYNIVKAAMLNNLVFSIAGITAVTALTVRSNVYNIFFALFLGVGIAIIPIASIYFGEEDKDGLRNAVKYTLKVGIILNVIAGAIIYAFPQLFIALFGVTDPEVAKISVVAIRMFAVSMPFCCVVFILDNYYLSCSNMFMVNFIKILQCLLVPVLFAFALSGFLGVFAIWIALLLAELLTIAAIPVAIRAKTGKWPKTLDDLLMFPEGFGGDPQKRLNISIGNSMEEVVSISQKVGEYCTSQGITDKRAYMMSLAIEEMAGNVVLHGFEPGENRYLDICVLYKNEELILTLRDNGKRFHPFEYVDALPAGEDPFKSIGIKMIRNMAKTVDYSYALGLNNIIIRI